VSFSYYIADGLRSLVFKKDGVQGIITSTDYKKNMLVFLTFLSIVVAVLYTFQPQLLADAKSNPQLLSFIKTIPPVSFGVGLFVLNFLFTLIGTGVIHLIARLLGGKTSIMQFFAVWLFLSILYILGDLISLVPFGGIISVLLSLYAIAVLVFMIKEVYQFGVGRAIAVLAILLGIIIVLVLLLAFILLAFTFGGLK
jgi:hypothetical protein